MEASKALSTIMAEHEDQVEEIQDEVLLETGAGEGPKSEGEETTEVKSADPGNIAELLGIETQFKDLATETGLTEEQKLTKGVRRLKDYGSEKDTALKELEENSTRQDIKRGLSLLFLQEILEPSEWNWDAWADEHTSLKRRARYNFMKLAQRKDVWPYIGLGQGRLLQAIRVTKVRKGYQEFDAFLGAFDLPKAVGPAARNSQFKKAVDVAITTQRMSNAGLEVTTDKVSQVLARGIKLTPSYIKELIGLRELGRDPIEVLDEICSSENPSEDPFLPAKRVKRCRSLAKQLSATIASIQECEDPLDGFEVSLIESLEAKLVEMKQRITLPAR